MFLSQLEFLRHMLDECSYIIKVTEGKTQQQVTDDETLSRAIVRSLEIIGEATRRIEPDMKYRYPQIDWKDMAGMRDRLIHHYFGIDYDIVFSTVTIDIPDLHYEIQRIIEIENRK